MSDYLTEGWPLSPTSTIYMDGTAVYGVRRYGIPGATNVVLRCEHADLIREVVAERIQQAKAEALREAAEKFWARLPDGTGNGRAYNSHRVADILSTLAEEIERGDS